MWLGLMERSKMFTPETASNDIERWVVDNAKPANSHIYAYYQKFKGKYIARYYYVKFKNKLPKSIYPIAIKVEGEENFLMKDGVYFGASGWFVSDYSYSEDYWFTKQRFNPFAYTNYDKIMQIIKNDSDLKYAAVDLHGRVDLLEYIDFYRKYPKLEILAKWGYPELITCHRYLNFEGHTWQQVTKIPKEWQSLLFIEGLPALQSYYKRGFSYKAVEVNKKLKSIFSGFYSKLKLNNESKVMHIWNYLSNLEYNEPNLYIDYLKYAIRYKKNLNDYYWLTPSDIHAKHREMLDIEYLEREEDRLKKQQEDAAKYALLEDGVKKHFKEHNVDCSKGDIKLITASSTEMIVKNGDELKICVGSLEQNYIKNMSENGNTILFGYANDKLDACIEYDWKRNEIMQCRAEHNGESEFEKIYYEMLGVAV